MSKLFFLRVLLLHRPDWNFVPEWQTCEKSSFFSARPSIESVLVPPCTYNIICHRTQYSQYCDIAVVGYQRPGVHLPTGKSRLYWVSKDPYHNFLDILPIANLNSWMGVLFPPTQPVQKHVHTCTFPHACMCMCIIHPRSVPLSALRDAPDGRFGNSRLWFYLDLEL